MRSKKQHKPTRKDIARQKAIEKRLKAEGVKLDHPKGKERFETLLRKFAERK